MRPRFLLATAGVAAAALALGIYLSGSWRSAPPASGPRAAPPEPEPAASVLGHRRPEFSLPDASGSLRSIDEWNGKVLVVNFWASWCLPCRKEMPLLIDLQRRYAGRGLQTLGIAVDTPEQATAFAEELGVNYPSLFTGSDVVELGKRYGNALGALPYTVVIDRGGVIRYTHLGALERPQIEQAVTGLL